ncbi:MAG: hypothetical protein ACKVXR_09965 [Planctomycetota bacterium]
MSTQGPDGMNFKEALLTATRTAKACQSDNAEHTHDLLKQLRELAPHVEKTSRGDKAVYTLATKITEQLASKNDPKPDVLFSWLNLLLEHLCTTLAATPDLPATPEASPEKPKKLHLDPSDLEAIRYKRWMADGNRFGEIMVRMAFLKAEDVERALELQRHKNCRLGEAMVDLGLLSRRGLDAALHLQKKKREPDAWTIKRGVDETGRSVGS